MCTVVRVCEPSYDTAPLKGESIEVHDLAYDDGTFPPTNVVDEWFEILRDKLVLCLLLTESMASLYARRPELSYAHRSCSVQVCRSTWGYNPPPPHNFSISGIYIALSAEACVFNKDLGKTYLKRPLKFL